MEVMEEAMQIMEHLEGTMEAIMDIMEALGLVVSCREVSDSLVFIKTIEDMAEVFLKIIRIP